MESKFRGGCGTEGSLLRNEPQYPTRGYAPHSGRGGNHAFVRDRNATTPCTYRAPSPGRTVLRMCVLVPAAPAATYYSAYTVFHVSSNRLAGRSARGGVDCVRVCTRVSPLRVSALWTHTRLCSVLRIRDFWQKRCRENLRARARAGVIFSPLLTRLSIAFTPRPAPTRLAPTLTSVVSRVRVTRQTASASRRPARAGARRPDRTASRATNRQTLHTAHVS